MTINKPVIYIIFLWLVLLINYSSGQSINSPLNINIRPILPMLDSSLILYSPFDSNAKDYSVRKHNLTGYNVTLKQGIIGNSYFFNGISSYIETPFHLDFEPVLTPFSMVAWVKVAPNCGYGNIIRWYRCGTKYSCSPADMATYGFYVNNSNKIEINIRDDQNNHIVRASTFTIDDNKWHLIIGTFNPITDTVRLYVDKCKIAEAGASFNSLTDGGNNTPFDIGRNYRKSGSVGYFKGQIDEVRIYRRELSDQEISTLYHMTKPVNCRLQQNQYCDSTSINIWLINPERDVSYYLYDSLSHKMISSPKFGKCFDSIFLTASCEANSKVFIFAKNFMSKDSIFLDTFFNITVHPNPVSDFSLSDTQSCLSNNNFIFFDDSYSLVDSISSFQWIINGVSILYAKDTSYSFKDSGSYLCQHIVQSTFGCYDTSEFVILIHEKPENNFNLPDSTQCLKSNYYEFEYKSDTINNSVVYNFGDGYQIASAKAGHRYTSLGNYLINMVVSTQFGCVDTFKYNAYIKASPQSEFTVDDTIKCVGDIFSFRSVSSPVYSNVYSWDLDDGRIINAYNTDERYFAAGSFNVKFKVVNKYGCSDSSTISIDVLPAPEINFKPFDTFQCLNQNQFKFEYLKDTVGKSFYIDFGDGTFSTMPSVKHSYSDTGTYNMSIKITNNYGCSDSVFSSVKVWPAPKSNFQLVDTNLCLYDTLKTVNLSDSGNSIHYYWLFGDGKTDSVLAPTHKFFKPGNYKIKLITFMDSLCGDTSERFVKINNKPEVSFLISSDVKQCLNNNLFTFINTTNTSNSALSFLWSINDSFVSNKINYSFIGKNAGVLRIELVGSYNLSLCIDSFSRNVQIIKNPVAKIDTFLLEYCKNIYQIKNNSRNFDSLVWEYNSANYKQDQPGFEIKLAESGWIKLKVFNGKICHDVDSVFLELINSDQEIYIPNAFTPNGDGVNDLFTLNTGNDKCLNYRMFIFNRWGQRVFSSNESDNTPVWDGLYKGREVSSGVYYYIILTNFENFHGTITLIR